MCSFKGIAGLTNIGDLFFVNTFTPLEEYLYIVASFYKIVKDDLWTAGNLNDGRTSRY